MQKVISLLQFVTCQEIEKPASQQCLEFCAGGGDWVRMNTQNNDKDYLISEAQKCNSICQQYGATFIVNNQIELALKVDADGIHLNEGDKSISEVRTIIGDHKIIGVTASNFQDILEFSQQGADYISLGPFSAVENNNIPNTTINLDNYTNVVKECNLNNIKVPIIAFGDIKIDDFVRLFKTGINGVGMSSYLAKQDNIGMETLRVLTEVGKAHSFIYANK